MFILSDGDGEGVKFKKDKIKKTGVFKFFKGFSLGDALNTTKPDKKFYDYLVDKYKIDLKESIMIGDKPPYDLKIAKELGVATVWFKFGRWKTILRNKKFNYIDYSIDDLRELLKIL